MAHDVFISYSRKDLSLIEPLVKDIEKRANVKCWIDWNGIESGSQFEDVIIKAIDSVKVVLFFLSENSMNSDYAKLEVNYAYNTRKKVVPIVLDGGSLRGFFLFKFGSVDFIDVNQERQYNKLINDLISWCGTAPQVVPQETPQIERSTPAPTPAPQPQSAPGPRPTVVRTATLHEVSTVKSTRQAQQSYNEAWAKWHAQREAKSYKVGDYYDDGTKQGVVFAVTADRLHGKILSLAESSVRLQWTSDFDERKRLIGADDISDGANNMAKVQQIEGWREKYPAFAWCADLGDGWYLPAIEELIKFTFDDAVRDAVNSTLLNKGGILVNKGVRRLYWSSTESKKDIYAWLVEIAKDKVSEVDKFGSDYVRAVSAF